MTTLTSFPYYQSTNSNVLSLISVIKHMVSALSCTVKLWMHLRDILGGLLNSRGIVYLRHQGAQWEYVALLGY